MNIRTKVTIVAVTVLLAVSAMLIISGYRSQNAAEERYVNEVLSGKRLLWDQLAGRLQEQMGTYTKVLTRDSVALKAIRKGQLGTVREQAATTHNMLFSDGTLERLQVFDINGDYIASFPQEFSGKTAKTLVHQVIRDAKVTNGINRDDDGSIQSVVAFPLFVRGKLKAVAVYSQSLQALVDRFQVNDGSDVFVIGPNSVVEYAANGNQLDRASAAGSLAMEDGLKVVEQDDQFRVTVAIPVVDEQGQPLATLVTSQDQTESYSVQATAAYTSIALVVMVLVGSTLGLFWYFRRVFRPIDQAIMSMTEIAAGNLNCALPKANRNDETGRLSAGLGDMVNHLRSLIGEISYVTDHLVSSTAHLSGIADQSKARTSTQREETDQVATAVNEMASTIQDVAVSADSAATAASNASDRTHDGQLTVEQTIASIESLAEDVDKAGEVINRLRVESENIGSVLDVIGGIAEQTNLLALNAAIEAARAGEQGRGFAVVADEVRTLASKTQESTQDIQRMIEKLQQGAEEAVDVMQHSQRSSAETLEHASSAKEALAEITRSVTEIDNMNNQIASADKNLSAVSEMIRKSVSRIAGSAEDSMTAAEDTARASKELSENGEKLGALVKRFEL